MIAARYLLLSVSFLSLLLLPGKKDEMLKLSKKYFPESYTVLKEYDEKEINELLEGNSVSEYVTNIATAVHEGWHSYQGQHSSYTDTTVRYLINDSVTFSVKNFSTFPSAKISSMVPAATAKKIFRYEDYINSKSKYHVTQQYGILGLLEEDAAYRQSFYTSVSLFNYYKDTYGWKDPSPWLRWLGGMGSYRFANAEFNLFISWYLQYAKAKQPAVYKNIVSNDQLRKLFQYLEKENNRLTALYNQYRETVIKQFGGRIYVTGNYIYDKEKNGGPGLYDKELAEMNSLLEQPQHQAALEVLRK